MADRWRAVTIVLVLGVTACGGSDDTVIRCGHERLRVDELVAETELATYDSLRGDPVSLVEAALRRLLVRAAVRAES